jgi:hypothetical protein
MKSFWALVVLVIFSFSLTSASPTGKIIRVPRDKPTIQAGIDAASNGDTVLVLPGTYFENINFHGKAIALVGLSGPKVTIIDGGQDASVVTFDSGETYTSAIRGFTLQNGNATGSGFDEGGGISVQTSSPTISDNIITKNHACQGDGIAVATGSPRIQDNIITGNSDGDCIGFGGGAILIRGDSAAQIVHNIISNNSSGSNGGGIALLSADTVLVQNNSIYGNTATANGGGISISQSASSVSILQNLITGNTAPTGNAIYWSSPPSLVISNTMNDSRNAVPGSSTLWGDSFCCSTQIMDNIIVASGNHNVAVTCNSSDFPSGVYSSNDTYSVHGHAFGGLCTSQNGTAGNISANPQFAEPNHGDYELRPESKAINAGSNSAPNLPNKDLARKPRIIGGTIDMGAYESWAGK